MAVVVTSQNIHKSINQALFYQTGCNVHVSQMKEVKARMLPKNATSAIVQTLPGSSDIIKAKFLLSNFTGISGLY